MKQLFAIALICASTFTFGQKIKNILDNKDDIKLKKYFEKGGNINETINVYIEVEDDYEIIEVHPLIYAVGENCIECVKLILNHDSIIDVDILVAEAFAYSMSQSDGAISKFLYEQKPKSGACPVCNNSTAVMLAAMYGREEWYFKLKDQVDLGYKNSQGLTIAHAAASGPSLKIAQDVFGMEGIELNEADGTGLTPLDYAASNTENHDIFQLLLDKKADLSKAWNILYWWNLNPSQKIFTEQVVQTRKSDVWYADEYDQSPLIIASLPFGKYDEYYKEQMQIIGKIVYFMLEDMKGGRASNLNTEVFFENSVTLGIINVFKLFGDAEDPEYIFRNYLNLLALMAEEEGVVLFYKNDLKAATQFFGEENIQNWLEEFKLEYYN